MLQPGRSWKRGRIGNLLKKTQCKGSDISQRNGKSIFPVADGRIKFAGGDQKLRTPTLIRERPIRGESRIDSLGAEGSLPPPQDSLKDASEAINDFWFMSGNFIYRHHVEPRLKLYSPREESFLIPLKYIDFSRTTHTNLDVMQESRIVYYSNIDGPRDLSDPRTGFTRFILLEEKPPDGYMWSGEGRLTRKQLTSRPDHLWPELWTKLGRNAKLRRSKNAPIKNRNSIMPEDYEESISVSLRTRNSKKPLRMLERNWKHQWLPPCLARQAREVRKERSVARLMISSQNLRVSWKSVNPQECVWKNLHQIIMRTILQEEGTIHCSITIWYTNLFLSLKQ